MQEPFDESLLIRASWQEALAARRLIKLASVDKLGRIISRRTEDPAPSGPAPKAQQEPHPAKPAAQCAHPAKKSAGATGLDCTF